MRRRLTLALVTLAWLGAASWPPSLPTVWAAGPGQPEVIESDENGLAMTWTPPGYAVTAVQAEANRYSRVEIPGLALSESAMPGYPQLPFYSTLVGLPPTGGARLRVVRVDREVVSLPFPPLPAPAPQPVRHLDDTPDGAVSIAGDAPSARLPDAAVYASDSFYPAEVGHLGPAQSVRDRRVAALAIYPLRVNSLTRQLEVIRYIHLEVIFDQPAPGLLAAQSRPDALTQALASTLINPKAAGWPSAPVLARSPDVLSPTSAAGLTKVIVQEPGLYALTYADLLAAGLPVATLDPRTLRLSHGPAREEVAIWVEGEADGAFDESDRLLFYAAPAFSRFSDEDVYLLEYGGVDGLRMQSRPAGTRPPAAGTAWRSALAETNRSYDPYYAGRDGDHWYWDELRQPDRRSAGYSIQLGTPLTAGPDARLNLWLQAYTALDQVNPDHRVAVAVNGTPVGEISWDGAQAVAATFNIPASCLRAGPNQVTLSLPGLPGADVEGVWLDAMSMTYAGSQPESSGQFLFRSEAPAKSYTLPGWASDELAVYDVTDTTAPRRIDAYDLIRSGAMVTLTLWDVDQTPADYLVVPNGQAKVPLALERAAMLEDPANGADIILIAHPTFAAAAATLAAHRAAEGFRVVTVDVQAIYDTYAGGRLTPEAIKAFLQHAYDTWARPAPLYVVLIGDGTYDFKDYSGYHPATFIPPYLADVDPWWGETAADNRFVTLSGDDLLPDMLIGRLSVTNPVEAQTVVDKIIHYETSPWPGRWNTHHLLVSDKSDGTNDFHSASDQAYAALVDPLVGDRYYYAEDNPSGADYVYTDADRLRAAFLQQFNAGAGLITFYGHSSWHQWSVDGLLRWHKDPALNDVARLQNGYRLPVVLEMTCFTAFFHHPSYPTLDESLVRQAGGGAVATWGSTGLGVAGGHDLLHAGFTRAVMQGGRLRLGAAALAGKLELYAGGFHLELLDTFTLLGDPALMLDVSYRSFPQTYLPIITRK
jgi:hypothetical protein